MRPVRLAAALTVLALTALAQPYERPLDAILNTIRLDARAPKWDGETLVETRPEAPLGQTFRTGEDVTYIHRVALYQEHWSDSWDPDERLVLTLWDGPEKNTRHGRWAMPYQRHMWEGTVPMFPIAARVEPERSYYFELTVEAQPLRPSELPREWVVAGEREGHAGGDRVIADIGVSRGDYPGGTAYVGGQAQEFDLWFETHVRRQRSRDELYERAFGQFDLTLASLAGVRAAVEDKDWDRAVTELVAHFESREDIIDPERRRPEFDPDFDTYASDLAAQGRVLMEDGSLVDLGPRWNHFAWWPDRGGVGLTRSGLRKPLSNGYSYTGNEKYARAFNDMLYCFFVDVPSPVEAGLYAEGERVPEAPGPGLAGGSMTSGLSYGARLLHGFYWYAPFVHSPNFTEDVRAAWIINMGEMAAALERMEGGGNWQTQMANALSEFGMDYPEFKRSPYWVEKGMDTLLENARTTVMPDGVLHETTMGYHCLVLNRYSLVLKQLREIGKDAPEDFERITEKMFEYVMYAARPDGTLPIWGDGNPPIDPGILERGAELFGREDFRYVVTNGAAGSPPEVTSKSFPEGGFHYIRSGWGRDAHYIGVRCGHFGFGSHGHFDALSVIASAFGRTVLVDPGIHVYGTPEAIELRSTPSHSTISVDGRDTTWSTLDAWEEREGAVYFAGRNEGYRGLEEVRHRRRIVFAPEADGFPALWAVFDDVSGPGEHEVVSTYRFADLPVRTDAAAKAFWTDCEDANLWIRGVEPASEAALEELICVTEEDGLTTAPTALFRQQAELPVEMTTVMVPVAGRVPEKPVWEARLLAAAGAPDGVRGVWVRHDERRATLVGCAEAGGAAFELSSGAAIPAQGAWTVARLRLDGGVWTLVNAINAERTN